MIPQLKNLDFNITNFISEIFLLGKFLCFLSNVYTNNCFSKLNFNF